MSRGYSQATAERVEVLFREYSAAGRIVLPHDIAAVLHMSVGTVGHVLHDAPWWTKEHSRAARREGLRRAHLAQAQAGYPALKEGRETMATAGWPHLQKANLAHAASGWQNCRKARAAVAAAGYPNLKKGRETQAAQGWSGLKRAREELARRGNPHMKNSLAKMRALGFPNLAKGRAVLAAAGHPELVKARERLAAAGFPNRRKSMESQASAGWPNLKRGQEVLAAKGYPNLARGRKILARDNYRAIREQAALRFGGNPKPLSHGIILRGLRTRECILQYLQSLDQSGVQDQQRTGRRIARRLHLGPTTVFMHLQALRNAGLIDRRNRPVSSNDK